MAARRTVRPADQLLRPAVESMIAAIGPADEDAALVALARRQASVIDGMPDVIAQSMLPNHTGQLLKSLGELHARAVKRRAVPRRVPSALDELRAARAAQEARRR